MGMFVVPAPGATLSAERIQALRASLAKQDWRLEGIVVAPVPQLPAEVNGGMSGDRQSERGRPGRRDG
jgi:hypothetical protein